MSTIAGLLSLIDPSAIKPYSEGMESVRREESGRQRNETGLIELARQKEQQAAEAMLMERIKHDPALAQQLFGGSTIAGLPTTGGPPPSPGAGAITQSPLGGGPAQTIPAYPDASRYAQVPPTGGGPIPPSTMGQVMPQVTPHGGPQSTIASLGPPPPGGMPGQAPNPVLEMARTNPRAAMMLQQQMQGQQDAALKRQEQRLKMGTAIMESLGQRAQGATDQPSWDLFLQDAAQIDPQLAARLPRVYSKEARDRVMAQAVDVKESLTLQTQQVAAQAELTRARMSGRVATTDQYLKALGVTPGTEQPEDMQRAIELQNRHLAEIEAGKVNAQIVPGPGGEYWMVNPRTGERRPVGGGGGATGTGTGTGTGAAGTDEPLRAPMTEGQSKTAVYTSTMQTGHDKLTALEKSGDYTSWKAPLAQLPGGKLLLTDKQKEYETAKGVFLTGLLRYQSAGQITKAEWEEYGKLYFPEPDDPPAMVEFKKKNRDAAIKTMSGALDRPLPGQQTGPQGQPTSQAPAATGGPPGAKVVTRAALQAENARRNAANRAAGRPELSNEQAEAMARQKGYEVR